MVRKKPQNGGPESGTKTDLVSRGGFVNSTRSPGSPGAQSTQLRLDLLLIVLLIVLRTINKFNYY